MRFQVKLGNEIVGFTALEAGDAPMGVASGRFLPTSAYSSIQPYCIEHRDRWLPIPGLAVSVPDGSPIECSGSVQIVDFSVELGEAGIEIYLNGVTNPRYEELFPHHVEAYKKQWAKG